MGIVTSPEPELTLGELVDRINARWADQAVFRETNSYTAGPATNPDGTPIAGSPANQRSGQSVREVVLPDRARYTAEENGQLVFELIVIGQQVYARGTVAMLLHPSVAPGAWVVTDIESVASNPMLGETAASQFAVITPPRYAIPDRLRPQTVRELGVVQDGAAECTLYGAADTTATGARIDLTFAIDATDRLCYIETTSIGISSRYEVEELTQPVAIEPPANATLVAGTPVSSPRSDPSPRPASTPADAPPA